jgi:hypothetical protein
MPRSLLNIGEMLLKVGNRIYGPIKGPEGRGNLRQNGIIIF